MDANRTGALVASSDVRYRDLLRMVRRAFPMSTVGPGIQLVTLALQAPSTRLTNPCPALLMAKSADTDGCLLLAHIDVERAHSVSGRKSFLIKTRDQYGTG